MGRLRISPQNMRPKDDTVVIIATGMPQQPKEHKLNARQQAFVDQYVLSKNSSDAARKAGYAPKSANVTGAQLLANPSIRAAVDARLAKQAKKLEITADRIQAEIAKIAFQDMGEYLDENGLPLSDFSGLSRDQTAAIRSITVEEFKDGRSDKREVRRIKFTLGDKEKALEMLAKQFGMQVEKHDHTHHHTVLSVLLTEIDEESRAPAMIDVTPPVDKKQ